MVDQQGREKDIGIVRSAFIKSDPLLYLVWSTISAKREPPNCPWGSQLQQRQHILELYSDRTTFEHKIIYEVER